MANAFSVQADFGDYIQPINTELVNFVLGSKQQKYDYNVAKIDETIAEFGIDLERQEDKDYVINKLNGVLDSVNNMGKMDLSNGNITRDIQQQIRGTLDDKIIGAAISTKNYRNFQGSLAQAQKDGTYSDINAGYALDRGGVASWLQGGSDELGSVSYTPYQDVNGKVTKNIKDLKEFNPERTIDIPYQDASGVNRIVSKKVKDLNEAEIRSYVMSNLDETSQKQLQINGWAKFNGSSDADLQNYAKSYTDGRLKQYDTNIALTRKQMESAPAYMVQDLKNRLNVLSSEKNSFKATMDNIGTDRDNMGRVIMQEQLVDQVTGAYADTSVSYELKNDTAYYEKAKLDFQKVKLLAEGKKKAAEAAGSDVTSNPQIRSVTAPFTQEEEFDPQERTQDRISMQETQASVVAKQIIRDLDPETRKIYDSLRQADASKTDAEVLNSMELDLTYVDEEGNPRFFKQVMDDLSDTYSDATLSYTETMQNSFDENIDDIYSEITSEGWANVNEFPLLQEDGSIVQMDTYLKENNISKEDFRQNVNGIQDKVKKSIYLNKAISEIQLNPTQAQVSAFDSMTTAGQGDGFMLNNEDFDRVNNYLKVVDADDSIFNYFEFKDKSTGQVLNKEDVDALTDSKAFIMKPKNASIASMVDSMNSGRFADTKVSSEGGLNKMISFDTSDFKEKLTKNFRALSANNLVIDPNLGKGGKELNDIHRRMQAFANSKGMVDVDPKKPIIIAESLSNPEELVIAQNDEDANPIQVSRAEVEQLLGKRIPSSKGQEITVNRPVVNKDIKSLNMSKAAHMDEAEVLIGMMNRGEVIPSVISKDELKTSIATANSGYRDAEGVNTPAGNLSDELISNDFNNLSVVYNPRNKGGVVTIMRKDTQEEIESYPVAAGEIQIHRNTVRYNPQLYMNKLLVNMVYSYKKEQSKSELYQKLAQSQLQDGRN